MNIVSGNAVNWLDCVAKGQQVTLKPISKEKDDLVSTVLLHLPQQKVIFEIYLMFIFLSLVFIFSNIYFSRSAQ